eukprot:scaffold708_cov526-Pavlova_lutheri.AAC.1
MRPVLPRHSPSKPAAQPAAAPAANAAAHPSAELTSRALALTLRDEAAQAGARPCRAAQAGARPRARAHVAAAQRAFAASQPLRAATMHAPGGRWPRSEAALGRAKRGGAGKRVGSARWRVLVVGERGILQGIM